MRNARQHKVDVAVAKALHLVAPFLMPEGELKADAGRFVTPRATETELVDALRYHDAAQHLTSVQGEVERQWKLNDLGRAWYSENE